MSAATALKREPALVSLQLLLATRGYSPGPIDGIRGKLTDAAFAKAQAKANRAHGRVEEWLRAQPAVHVEVPRVTTLLASADVREALKTGHFAAFRVYPLTNVLRHAPCRGRPGDGYLSTIAEGSVSEVEHGADEVPEPQDHECPGPRGCHGCMRWCSRSGDVAHVCDTRLRNERCDEHPVPPTAKALRGARVAAERMIAEGKRLQREGATALEEVRDGEKARAAYWRQVAEEERRMFEPLTRAP